MTSDSSKQFDVRINPKVIPFRCPNCRGFGKLNWGKTFCHSCKGNGVILVDQETALIYEQYNRR